MADVRLTAINPEDSSAVPVACNAKGELLLEEPEFGQIEAQGAHFTSDVTLGTSPSDAQLRLLATGGANFDSYVRSLAGVRVGGASFGAFTASINLESSGRAWFSGGSTRINDAGALLIGTLDWSTSGTKAAIDVDGSAQLAGGNVDIYSDGRVLLGEGAPNAGLSINVDPGAGVPTLRLATSRSNATTTDLQLAGSAVIRSTASLQSVVNENGSLVWRIGGDDASAGIKDAEVMMQLKADSGLLVNREVTVTSRNQKWVLTEQGGICYMMSPSTADALDGDFSQTPPRDVVKEIDYLFDLLRAVYEKLKMSPESGWPVWDGSD